MLLYPVYTLLFSDTGLSVWQISSLFVIWSVSSLVLEVPSGALADATSRRRLLILGPLLTAVAFALWVAAPGCWVFALGFVLWGLKSALTSGALEALVYEELRRRRGASATVRHVDGPRSGGGRAGRDVLGCCRGAGDLGRWFSGGRRGQCRRLPLASIVAMLFPENRIRPCDEPDLGWADTLAAGLREARRSPSMRAAVILVGSSHRYGVRSTSTRRC